MGSKIDISSTAVEKGIDLAKDFLDKLIMPSVEETGLLLKEKVTYWKFRNQVKMLNKAKLYCERHKISPKTISLKLLCPLLDYSALEEDEGLQDKWAILLSNMVDSDQNIENHVFPYILSQISSNEFALIENVYDDKLLRVKKLKLELQEFKINEPELRNDLEASISKMGQDIKVQRKSAQRFDSSVWDLEKKKSRLEMDLKMLAYKESGLIRKMKEAQQVPEVGLKEFEISNLIRLGLIKFIQTPYAHPQRLEIPYESGSAYDMEYSSGTHKVDVEVEIESEEEYVLTELGELFINACKEKS